MGPNGGRWTASFDSHLILKSRLHSQFGIIVQISNETIRPFVENRFYVSFLYLSDDILY